MSNVAVTPRVISRNNIGQFLAACELAAGETVSDLIDEGMAISRADAPVGSKHDPRTTTLKDSFYKQMLSRTQGVWGNFARHALAVERGARPHLITGNLSFFWEAQGRKWVPAAIYYRMPGLKDVINHPGNRAQPFLRPAFDVISHRVHEVMRRHYPGGRIG